MDAQRVRTEYVLSNVLANLNKTYFLTKQSLPIKISPALNTNEEKVFEHVLNVCKNFYQAHEWRIRQTNEGLPYIKEEKFEELLSSLYDKLFANRISWSRIMLFTCIVSSFLSPLSSTDRMLLYFSKFVEEKLSRWIDDHNGWDAIKVDEPSKTIPFVNLGHIFFRRSERLAGKEKLRYLKYFC